MPREFELRSEQLRIRIDERGTITLEQLGRRQFAVPASELRLVIEELQMARRAGHEQIDDFFRFRRKRARLRRKSPGWWGRRRGTLSARQLSQRRRPEPH